MRRSRQGQSLAHNEGNTFFVKARYLRRNFSNFLFFTGIAYKQNRIVAINETQTRSLCRQVERARSKMLCAVDYIFNLLCAFNCLQPMKKFVFSVTSRATGRLQIKPSGSGDENVVGRKRIHTTVRKEQGTQTPVLWSTSTHHIMGWVGTVSS